MIWDLRSWMKKEEIYFRWNKCVVDREIKFYLSTKFPCLFDNTWRENYTLFGMLLELNTCSAVVWIWSSEWSRVVTINVYRLVLQLHGRWTADDDDFGPFRRSLLLSESDFIFVLCVSVDWTSSGGRIIENVDETKLRKPISSLIRLSRQCLLL